MNVVILLFYMIIFTYIICSIFNYKKNRLILLIVILVLHYNVNVILPNDYFIIIDVNQGDSSLFYSNNKCILIDTGGLYNKTVSESTIVMLKSLGIRHIDVLFLTHGDFDHMGDAIYFVNNFEVKQVVFNNNSLNELELKLIEELSNKKIKYEIGERDTVYTFNNLNIKLLNFNLDNENDSSLVLYIIFKNKKILMMGDASSKTENMLLEHYNLENIDYLKVGHHGSKTSTSSKFIDVINPKIAFISVGLNNRYHHPNTEVLDNLRKSKVYRTDKVGSIKVTLNNKVKIETFSA